MLAHGGTGNPDPEEVLRKVQTAKDLYRRLKASEGVESAFHAGKELNDLLLNSAEDVLAEMAGIDLLELRYAASEATDSGKVGQGLKEEFSGRSAQAIQSLNADDILPRMLNLSNQEKAIVEEFRPQLWAIDEAYGPKMESLEKKWLSMQKKRDAFAKRKDQIVEQWIRKNSINMNSGTFRDDYDAVIRKIHESQEYIDYLASLNDMDNAYMAVWNQKKNVESEWQTKQAPINNAMQAKLKPIQDEIASIKDEFFIRVKDEVLQSSPISETQAATWANAQEITPAAVKRLERSGYRIDDLRKNMAEFYRLTSGRLPNVAIVTEGRRRAVCHTEVQQVSIDTHFSKKTLFHEMAHTLENDPAILAMAMNFRDTRGKGRKIRPLRELDPGKNYRSDERALEDEFITPYVGKVYPYALTEVMSMGMQMFADAEATQRLLSADPEMFHMIYGMLLSPPPKDVLMDRVSEADEKQQESVRKTAFFDELTAKSKSGKFLQGREDRIRIEPFFMHNTKRPSMYVAHAITSDGRDITVWWRKGGKSQAYAFAYLYLVSGSFNDVSIGATENIVRRQYVPSWYRNPENPDSKDHIPELL